MRKTTVLIHEGLLKVSQAMHHRSGYKGVWLKRRGRIQCCLAFCTAGSLARFSDVSHGDVTLHWKGLVCMRRGTANNTHQGRYRQVIAPAIGVSQTVRQNEQEEGRDS
jgi:hypothetical protein